MAHREQTSQQDQVRAALEPIPSAATGEFRVIAVDYRLTPKHAPLEQKKPPHSR